MRPLLPLALLAGLTACHPQTSSANGSTAVTAPVKAGKIDRSHAGEAAPTAAFRDADGDPTSLAAFEGKPALVNFWATWCAPCKKELPTLDRLAAQAGGGLQVVTVAEDESDKAAAYLAHAKLAKLEAWADPKLAMTDALKINDLPMTILFDAKGREVWRVRGELDWQGEQAKALLAEARR